MAGIEPVLERVPVGGNVFVTKLDSTGAVRLSDVPLLGGGEPRFLALRCGGTLGTLSALIDPGAQQ